VKTESKEKEAIPELGRKTNKNQKGRGCNSTQGSKGIIQKLKTNLFE